MITYNLDPFMDIAEDLMLQLLIKARSEDAMSQKTSSFIEANCGRNTVMTIDEEGMRELFIRNSKELRELLVKESKQSKDYDKFIKQLDSIDKLVTWIR